jgi:hypothetical protein
MYMYVMCACVSPSSEVNVLYEVSFYIFEGGCLHLQVAYEWSLYDSQQKAEVTT